MIYYDKDLNASRFPPKIYKMHETTPLETTKVTSQYTIKDIT